MDFNFMIGNYRNTVDKRLEKFFELKLIETKHISRENVVMVNAIKDFTLRGGKRLRAALVYYAYKCFRDDNNPSLIDASLAIELLQSFLLIHDDIIDQDILRRGGPTVHVAYNSKLKNFNIDKENLKHIGESFAIIAGDLCFCYANELLANSQFNEYYKNRALAYFNEMSHKVIYGQALDMYSSFKTDFSAADLMLVHKLKTATYSAEGPLHLGAILAGASKIDLDYISTFAVPLGQAFQLQDDILGLFGEKNKLGKNIGSDLKEGKKNLLIIKALEKADAKERKIIQSSLGNKDLTVKELSLVRQIVYSTGSLDHSKKLIHDLVFEAKDKILKSNYKKEGKDFLLMFADYLIDREY